MEDGQSVDNDLVSKWLETTEKEHPHLFHGSRVTRFREIVNSFRDILSAIIQPDDANAMVVVDPDGVRRREFLQEITKIGCCVTLERYFDNDINVDATDDDGVTALHLAAEYGNYQDLEVLLKNKAKIEPNKRGLTALHIVALLTKPSRKLAELLIHYMRKQKNAELINVQTRELKDASRNGNTALHFAVENERVSSQFIRALETINPVLKNGKGDTAFHVAARSENPDIIVHMLKVFNPAKKGWEMKDIDSDEGPTLIEICARRGNAEAVDLLIKCGADITKKVLFLLVDESVNDRKKTGSLLDVYRTIADNCVLCEWMKETPEVRQNYPRRTEPKAYGEKQRKIMLKLLEEGRNVMQHAIRKGAKAFLYKIFNTPNVYKINKDEPGVVEYDVSNFIVPHGRPNVIRRCLSRTNKVDSESQSSTTQGPSGSSNPNQSYLQLMTTRGIDDLWYNTGVLTKEPFLSATKPICTLTYLIYSAFALIQLIYMICFSWEFLPPPCSVNSTDNTNATTTVHCNVEPHAQTTRWLIWPVLIIAFYIFPNVTEKRGTLPKAFPFVAIAWVITYHLEGAMGFLICTMLMHLVGWLLILSSSIYTFESLYTFYFLMKEIMLERSLLSSCIMSVFVIVSFSSAIHVLRIPSYDGNATYGGTMYDIFATALGTGEFIKETNRPEDISDISYILRTAFAIYLCIAVIVVLNILTSTMIDRYQNAKVTAKISWRFYAVKSGVHSFLTSEVLSLSTILFIFHYCDKIISCLRPVCRHFYPEWYQYKVSLEERDDRLILTLSKDERTN